MFERKPTCLSGSFRFIPRGSRGESKGFGIPGPRDAALGLRKTPGNQWVSLRNMEYLGVRRDETGESPPQNLLRSHGMQHFTSYMAAALLTSRPQSSLCASVAERHAAGGLGELSHLQTSAPEPRGEGETVVAPGRPAGEWVSDEKHRSPVLFRATSYRSHVWMWASQRSESEPAPAL